MPRLNKNLIPTVGLRLNWFDEKRTVFQDCSTGICKVVLSDGSLQADEQAATITACECSEWAAWDGGALVVFDSRKRRFIGADIQFDSMGPDGAYALKGQRNSAGPWIGIELDGSQWHITDGDIADFGIHMLGQRRAVWIDPSGQVHTNPKEGSSITLSVQPRPAWWPRAVQFPDDSWHLLYQDRTTGALALDDRMVAPPGNYFRPDIRVANGLAYIVWSTNIGETDTASTILSVPQGVVNLPLLAQPITLPTFHFTHSVLIAPFKDPNKQAGTQFRIDDGSLGRYTENPDPSADIAAAGNTRVFVAHDGPNAWVPPSSLRRWDVPLIEFYLLPSESMLVTAARWRANLQILLASWPYDCAVIPMFYCQGGAPPNEVWAVAQVLEGLQYLSDIVNISPRIKIIAPFAFDRANGITAHPELQQAFERLKAAAVPGVVLEPLPEPKKPPTPGGPVFPRIDDSEVIDLAHQFLAAYQVGNDEANRLRDTAYYGKAYYQMRGAGISHENALAEIIRTAPTNDYINTALIAGTSVPDIGDDNLMEFSTTFKKAYTDVGRYQKQSPEENARDEFYWLKIYILWRIEHANNHEQALKAVRGGIFDEAHMVDPDAPKVTIARAVSGRLRVANRRLQNDDGWWPWLGVADFTVIADALRGRKDDVLRRFDTYMAAKRTIIRVMGMLGDPVWVGRDAALDPREAGYWNALTWVVDQAAQRGLYVEHCFFADAQIVMPSDSDREAICHDLAQFTRDHVSVVAQLANEPFKNGWSGPLDPQLLHLADMTAGILGHRDFSVGDPTNSDAGGVDVGQDSTTLLVELSKHANICVMHPDRSGAPGETGRWRRWLDHLEGFAQDPLVQMGPSGTIVLDEPMGAGTSLQPGKRETDPDALIAGQFVAACCGLGYTFHLIQAEFNNDVSAIPGLLECADVLSQIPCSPEWVYKNDSWVGAPTNGITWTGQTGKVRCLVSGNRAWVVTYGEGDWNSVVWRPGFERHELVVNRPHVAVWTVNL